MAFFFFSEKISGYLVLDIDFKVSPSKNTISKVANLIAKIDILGIFLRSLSLVNDGVQKKIVVMLSFSFL
jgi:hypothetical protein